MEEKRKAEETFQSTLPIQGETCMGSGGKTIILHFNPLSLYRERRWARDGLTDEQIAFQSTLPIQGETIFSAS